MDELTTRAVRWAGSSWGRDICTIASLRGGSTSTMRGLTGNDGAKAVLRLVTREPWRTHGPGLVAREAAVQQLLGSTGIPAPTTLGLDAEGIAAGAPAHLMSRLDGQPDLASTEDALLNRLAQLIRMVHVVDPGTARPRDYQSWAPPSKRLVPAWAERPALWRAAFALLDEPPPPYTGTFLHRDLHLGNVLWSEGEVSGLVDWVETSWGPAGLDIAHATTYLALLHGVEVAARFRALLESPSVDSPECPGPRQDYWDIMDVIGYLPDPTKVARPWHDRGVNVPDRLVRCRLELWLASVLEAP